MNRIQMIGTRISLSGYYLPEMVVTMVIRDEMEVVPIEKMRMPIAADESSQSV